MRRRPPVDQARMALIKGESSIIRLSHIPSERAPRQAHNLAKPCWQGSGSQSFDAANPSYEPWSTRKLIKPKPARMRRLSAGGVNGNHFKIQSICQTEQGIVRAIAQMLAAHLKGDA